VASSSLRTLVAVAALGAFQAADGALLAQATVAWLLLLHAAAALEVRARMLGACHALPAGTLLG
jgi:hypothetical protein